MPGIDVRDAPQLAARGRYQRENLALALVACELLLGDTFDRARAIAAAALVVVPGRLQAIGRTRWCSSTAPTTRMAPRLWRPSCPPRSATDGRWWA